MDEVMGEGPHDGLGAPVRGRGDPSWLAWAGGLSLSFSLSLSTSVCQAREPGRCPPSRPPLPDFQPQHRGQRAPGAPVVAAPAGTRGGLFPEMVLKAVSVLPQGNVPTTSDLGLGSRPTFVEKDGCKT